MDNIDSLVQEARDALADLEDALNDGDLDAARDWAQQLEGRALDIIDDLNRFLN